MARTRGGDASARVLAVSARAIMWGWLRRVRGQDTLSAHMSPCSYNLHVGRAARAHRRYFLRVPLVRRLTSAFLALVFMGFTAETLIADVHDGDASAAEIEAISGGAAMGANEAPSSPTPFVPDESSSGHSAHACHCVHAHGGLLGAAEIWSSVAQPVVHVPGWSDVMPSSVSPEPRIRPPEA